jgi:hypothetical protein
VLQAQSIRIAACFALSAAQNARIRLNFPAYQHVFVVIAVNRDENPPDLRLRRNAPGMPLPWPVLAVILR